MDEIRTDVDRLIHALQTAPGRRLTVAQLQQGLGLTRAQVKKWVSILESEEHVRVHYTFNDEHVTWVSPVEHQSHGAPDSLPLANPAPAGPQAGIQAIGRGAPLSAPGQPASLSQNAPAATEAKPSGERMRPEAGVPKEETASGENESGEGGSYYELGQTRAGGRRAGGPGPALSNPDVTEMAREAEGRYRLELEKREQARAQRAARREERETEPKEAQADRAGAAADSQAASGMSEPGEPAPKAAQDKTFAPAYSIPQSLASSATERVSTLPSVGTGGKFKPLRAITTHVELAEPVSFPVSVEMPPMPQLDPEAMRFNEKLQAAMGRIKAKGEQLDALKEKKKQLLREVYRPLERKMDYGAEAIADALLKYENRLLKLRERASQLPQEVADLDERQAKMAQVAAEMQRVYDETAHLLQDSLSSVMESRERAAGQLQAVREGVGTQEQNVSRMQEVLSQLSGAQAEVEARMSEARGALQEEQARLNQAQEMLSQLSSAKAGLEGQVQTAAGELKIQKRTLREMDAHLARIDQVKSWVEENRAEYDGRMKQLADYIRSADEEYAYLRESVESGFVRRHLRDLRALSESYEFELAQANQMEENVDQQIGHAKEQMASLIAQAKRIAYLQEMQLEEGEGDRKSMAAAALGRGAMFGALEAKEKERVRIRGMIRDVIEGKSETGSAGRPAIGARIGAPAARIGSAASRPSRPAPKKAAKSQSRKK
ncbi:MAG: hypothetical protein KGH63_02995 [Candidatus Micrarchaeota archaeon]|nr:hypothetical protein [Candidatus Micrarchaeota archaeon]